MLLNDGTTILFTGDSITDCGRSRSMRPGADLGHGYVNTVRNLISQQYPDRQIAVLNTGISGNTVTDLAARWQRDVLDHGPHWLSVLIGINDVWRLIEGNFGAVTIDLYETTYRELLNRTRAALAGLVLMTPYVIEPDRADAMRTVMDSYGEVVRRLAGEFDAVLVDTQGAFDRYVAGHPGEYLSSDRVHPNETGHAVIAGAFLNAIEFEGALPSGNS